MTQVAERHLAWEACYNVRDTGGYDTEDGGQTRWRSLVRADSLSRLSPSGSRALVSYGVGTIIDLRWDSEVAEAPNPFAHRNDVTYLNIPVGRAYWMKEVIELPSTREVNALILERCPRSLACVVRAFARAPDGGVLVHCSIGKDRTGLAVALLLSLAGVAETAIAEDYALSNVYLQPVFEEFLRRKDDAAERAKLARWLAASEDNMLATLEHLRVRYGGVCEYLLAAGMTTEDIERVRARLAE